MKKKTIKLTLATTLLAISMLCTACGNKESVATEKADVNIEQSQTTVDTEIEEQVTEIATEVAVDTEVTTEVTSGSYIEPKHVEGDEAAALLAKSEELKSSPVLQETIDMVGYPFTTDDLVSYRQDVYDNTIDYIYYFKHTDCVAGLTVLGENPPMAMDICNEYGPDYPVVIFNNFDRSPSNAKQIYDALRQSSLWVPYVVTDYKEGDTSITVTYPVTGESITIEL